MEAEVRAVGKHREPIEEATDVRTAADRADIFADCYLAHLELQAKAIVFVNDVDILSDLFDSFGDIGHVFLPVCKQWGVNNNMEVAEGRR